MKSVQRCPWCENDPLYQQYHDSEWGTPCTDDRTLFEFVLLESAQAGLAWITILRKRVNYRRAFADFDPQKVARFNRRSVERLMADAGIVRNRLKIEAAIGNARRILEVQSQFGSFSSYLWQFVDGHPVTNHWLHMKQVPASTALSDAVSRDMKQRGFRFIGSTICYAFLQATGLVNDHLVHCYRHKECIMQADSPQTSGA